ncbi:MAG: [acyl-carrier-protein] S-malonyltransferase [Gammaproteobacteria bacterium]|nr:[acyl-carrier-protein] S-malonyltransferase [Gammaproteobacteria bacterium]
MKLACMFPGQGSQSVGMLKSIGESSDIIVNTFQEAQSVLSIDFWSMVQNGPELDLNDTMNTQVVMLISDVAMYRFLQAHGMPRPQMMAGHSLGEYAALVAAQAIDFKDAVRLVRMRAELMTDAVRQEKGAMAAIIGLDNAVVEEICHKIVSQHPGKSLEAANLNAPGQVVIAGHIELVEQSLPEFEKAGARMSKILPVSVPCHCRLMLPAAEKFYNVLKSTPMNIPEFQLISNVDVSIYNNVERMKVLLSQQLYFPVQWTRTLEIFNHNQVNLLVECGPGKVLCGLAKRTIPQINAVFCYEVNHLPQWDVV